MDFRITYSNDLLNQAEIVFNDRELSQNFMKQIKETSPDKESGIRKLTRLKARIEYLENKAKNSLNELAYMEKQTEQYEIYMQEQEKKQKYFTNAEIYDFFTDENKNNEFLTYLKETATQDRINLAIRQFETIRTQCDKMIKKFKKQYTGLGVNLSKDRATTITKIKENQKVSKNLEKTLQRSVYERF